MMVEVRNLTVRFGEFAAVRNVSFSVKKGEVFGFLGANGAGKTTTIRVLCGLLVPTEGDVRVAGEGFEDGGFRLKAKVGYMSQRFTLYEDLTVDENLSFASQLRKLDPKRFVEKKRELLEFISFDRDTGSLVRDLPGGVKQQVSLAAALLHDPDVVFLDEPTAGVTPASRARFWALIRRLASRGKTIFVTTHYMDEAEQCERIALMRSGELIALDTPSALKGRTFPRDLLELDPTGRIDQAHLAAAELMRDPAFSLFEPYGMRYHAEIADPGRWKELEPRVRELFALRPIRPSLEDVFIRLVEGSAR